MDRPTTRTGFSKTIILRKESKMPQNSSKCRYKCPQTNGKGSREAKRCQEGTSAIEWFQMLDYLWSKSPCFLSARHSTIIGNRGTTDATRGIHRLGGKRSLLPALLLHQLHLAHGQHPYIANWIKFQIHHCSIPANYHFFVYPSCRIDHWVYYSPWNHSTQR